VRRAHLGSLPAEAYEANESAVAAVKDSGADSPSAGSPSTSRQLISSQLISSQLISSQLISSQLISSQLISRRRVRSAYGSRSILLCGLAAA